ncbi:MAG TPA: hypothetical protein VEA59_03290 [Patescibacteria group bacterium]|nr:hypothetical protein [Patescibacteria group bacterium]
MTQLSTESGFDNPREVAARVFEIQRRASDIIEATVEEKIIYDDSEKNKEALKKTFHGYLPEADEDFDQKLKELGEITLENSEKYIPVVAKIMTELIGKHLTLQKLEERLMEYQEKVYGYIKLSRGLTYEIQGTACLLHIPVTFFDSHREALDSLKEGFKNLAKMLKSDERFLGITEVRGRSDLVADKQKIISGLGFDLITLKGEKVPREAVMSKDKLIELYA